MLLQQGKGADVGAAFGSGASNTVFGSAGAGTFLSRMTAWLAVGFFAIAFGLAYTAKQRVGTHVIEGLPVVPVESRASGGAADGCAGVDSGTGECRFRPSRRLTSGTHQNSCRSGGIGRHAILRG
ncbi:MAG: preprotein translocase subunit SecG [Pseudomonadales bacterium]